MADLCLGMQVKFRRPSQFNGLPESNTLEKGVFLEYSSEDGKFCKLLTKNGKVIICNIKLVKVR